MAAPLQVGVAGSGFIARGFTLALEHQPDMRLAAVLTRRRPDDCADFPRRDLLTNSIDELIERSELIVECSGDVLHATNVVDAALRAGRPLVTMNAEFHVTTGSYFVSEANGWVRQASVGLASVGHASVPANQPRAQRPAPLQRSAPLPVLTEAHGDQPGSLAALAEDARAMGFRVLVYGNRKGYYHANPPPEQMQFWAKKQGLSLDQVTAATDGTKLQIEQALVANGLGATIARDGLLGPACETLEQGGQVLALEAAKLGHSIADYVLAPKAPAGIFIACETDPRQQAALEYLKLGPGPYYVLVQNYHLCHLEIAKTIRRVRAGGGALLHNSARPAISVATIAKRDLKPGERIRKGIGSFDVRGEAMHIEADPDHVPIGLVAQAVVKQRVEAGQRLTFADIELPDSLALRAWRSIVDESGKSRVRPGARKEAVLR